MGLLTVSFSQCERVVENMGVELVKDKGFSDVHQIV